MPTQTFASLTPREFMETPKGFGRVDEPVWVTPPKGADDFCYDQLLAARHQHEWSLAFRRYATHDYGSVNELARHHGIYYPGFARILRGTAHLTVRHLGVMARHAARNRAESSTKVAELNRVLCLGSIAHDGLRRTQKTLAGLRTSAGTPRPVMLMPSGVSSRMPQFFNIT